MPESTKSERTIGVVRIGDWNESTMRTEGAEIEYHGRLISYLFAISGSESLARGARDSRPSVSFKHMGAHLTRALESRDCRPLVQLNNSSPSGRPNIGWPPTLYS